MTLRELMSELANLSDNGKNDDKEVIIISQYNLG